MRRIARFAVLLALAACGDSHVVGPLPPAKVYDDEIAAKAGDSAHLRYWIGDREEIKMDEYFRSEKHSFYAILTKNGTLEVRKGSSPRDDFGLLWSSPAPSRKAIFSMKQDPSGALLIASGSGKTFAGYVWRSPTARPREPHYTVLGEDGNLCTYVGRSPAASNENVWCTHKTAPVTWLADGYRLMGTVGHGRDDEAWYWGFVHMFAAGPGAPTQYDLRPNQGSYGPFMNLIPPQIGGQHFKFVEADGTLRFTADPSMCVVVTTTSAIKMETCDSFVRLGAPLIANPRARGWYYRASDRTIHNSHRPGQCLGGQMDMYGGSHQVVLEACNHDRAGANPHRQTEAEVWRLAP